MCFAVGREEEKPRYCAHKRAYAMFEIKWRDVKNILVQQYFQNFEQKRKKVNLKRSKI